MTDIDWNTAPEWATHYGPENDSYCESWYRVADGKIVEFAEVGSAIGIRQPANQGECFYHPIEDLIALWTGEGLPPVGTVCEWKGTHGGYWVGCEVVALSQSQFVLRHSDSSKYRPGQFEVFSADPVQIQFRPIRTPEQIAAEKRSKAIREIQADLDVPLRIAIRAYEKGYRKEAP